MMKSVLSLLSLTVALSSAHAANDDMILQTRVDQPSMSWLVEKTRVLLSNNQIGDGTTGTSMMDDITVPLTNLLPAPGKGNTLPKFDLGTISNELLDLWKLDVRSASLRVRVPSISYAVGKISLKPSKLSVEDPTLDLNTDVSVDSLNISLNQGIQVDVMFVNPANNQLESYFTASLDPTSFVLPKGAPELGFNVDFTAKHDETFSFQMKDSDFTSVTKFFTSNQSAIQILAMQTQKPLSADQIKVNPVIVKLNANLSRSISFDSFKPIVQAEIPDLTKQIFTVVAAQIQRGLGKQLLQHVFSITAPDKLSVNADGVYAGFNTAIFTQPEATQLSLGLQGDFCTSSLFQSFGTGCVAKMPAFTPAHSLSAEENKMAKDEVTAKLASGKQDVAFSVSEEYLNRLLKTILDANVFGDQLKNNNLAFGPKGIFIVLDQDLGKIKVYLDLEYSGAKGIQHLLISEKHPIHFPLAFEGKISVTAKADGTPTLVIKTGKIVSSPEEIIHGVPELGLDSKLLPVLKKKVAGLILKLAGGFENYDLPTLDLPLFTGVGLEKSTIEASQHGRLHIYFKM